MADIARQLKTIQNATRGEEVRDSIITAINAMNNEDHPMQIHEIIAAITAGQLNGTDLFDAVPVYGSKRAVESQGLYNILLQIETALDRINGEVIP